MRPRLRLSSFRNQRGAIMLFVMLSIVFLLMIGGGLTSDVASLISLKGEVQTSLDASALAGAGKLGFGTATHVTARDFAVDFASKNPTRRGSVVLQRNDANNPNAFNAASAPYGDVLIGTWNPALPDGIGPGLRFNPTTDPVFVNSVMCRYKRQIPASFMSLMGLLNMTVATTAVATANPPATPPPDTCLFPIGVGSCPFQAGGSAGCGVPVTFITSSGKDDGAGCVSPPCTNSAAWVNLEGGEANANYLKNAIAAAAGGACASSSLKTGDNIPTNNGMIQAVFNELEPVFVNKYNTTGTHTIKTPGGEVTYEGPGWKVFIPVIQTECPAGAISGAHQIIGWTEFVMTQVINHGECAVANHWTGNAWDPLCPPTNGTGTAETIPNNAGGTRAIFGYYSCTIIPANPNPLPGPMTSIATILRLVR
jgi:hypothetical protein